MMAGMHTVCYVHRVEFRAVHRLKDNRTGNPAGPTLGHHYLLDLLFEGPSGLLIPEIDPGISEITEAVESFIAEHWDQQDLTRLTINPTPINLCWYLTEVLAGRVAQPDLLTTLRIAVDGRHSYMLRREPAAAG